MKYLPVDFSVAVKMNEIDENMVNQSFIMDLSNTPQDVAPMQSDTQITVSLVIEITEYINIVK